MMSEEVTSTVDDKIFQSTDGLNIDAISFANDIVACGQSRKEGNIWDGRLTLLSTVTSASISKNIPCGVSSVACCNSTGHVYVGRDDGILSVYSDCLDEIHNINAHDNIITALSVNPFNSAQCISVCWDGRICLIDCDSNHMECHEGHSDMIYGVAHSPKRAGVFATVGKDSFMRIWDNRSLNEGCTALLPLQQIGSKCCWSSQSDNLIACGTEDGCINTIDIRTNGMMKTWSGQSHRITSLVSPSICTPNLDNRLISASVDKSICAQVFEAEEEPNQRRKRLELLEYYATDMIWVENYSGRSVLIVSGNDDCVRVINEKQILF